MNLGMGVAIVCLFMFLASRLDDFSSSNTRQTQYNQLNTFLGQAPKVKSLDLEPAKQAYIDIETFEPVEREFHKILDDTNDR